MLTTVETFERARGSVNDWIVVAKQVATHRCLQNEWSVLPFDGVWQVWLLVVLGTTNCPKKRELSIERFTGVSSRVET
jgi:hypothetical protein